MNITTHILTIETNKEWHQLELACALPISGIVICNDNVKQIITVAKPRANFAVIHLGDMFNRLVAKDPANRGVAVYSVCGIGVGSERRVNANPHTRNNQLRSHDHDRLPGDLPISARPITSQRILLPARFLG